MGVNGVRRTWMLGALVGGLGLGVPAFGAGDVVISQLWGGVTTSGTASQPKADYVELFNRTPNPINMSGWSIAIAASPTATAWVQQNLTGTIQGSSYYLIRVSADGTTAGNPIPTPDEAFSTLSGTTLSTTTGKMILRDVTTVLGTTACPTIDSHVIDRISWGSGGTCFEGSAGAPAATITGTGTTPTRIAGGCVDTDQNSTDFVAIVPNPHNAAFGPVGACVFGACCNNTTAACTSTTSAACASGGGTYQMDNLACSPDPCPPKADLSIAISSALNATCTDAGSALQIVYTVSNAGPDAGTNVTAMIAVPAQFGFSGSTPGGTLSSGVLTVNLGTIAASGSVQITLLGSAVPGIGSLTARVTTDQIDPVAGNNSAATSQLFVRSTTGSPHRTIFTNIASSPLSLLPAGFAGGSPRFFFTTTGSQEIFGRPYLSEDGSRFIMRARSDFSTLTQNEALIIVPTNGAAPQLVAQEGVTPLGSLTEFAAGTDGTAFDNTPAVNNNGDFVFSTTSTAAANTNNIVVKSIGSAITVVARQGQTSPQGIVYGTVNNSLGLSDAGQALFYYNGNPTNTLDEHIVGGDGSTVITAESVTMPGNQTGGPFALSAFSIGSSIALVPMFSGDGTHSIYAGALSTTGSPAVLVVDGNVVLQGGVTQLVGGTVSTINGYSMRGSHWIAYGSNSDGKDWVIKDGVAVAERGGSIVPGSPDHWAEAEGVTATFFGAVTNRFGDYAVLGITDDPLLISNAFIVFNGTTIAVRESDPVDVDNNGSVDGYIQVYRNDRLVLTDEGKLFFNTQLRDEAAVCAANTSTKTGDVLLMAQMPVAHGACCGSGGVCAIVENSAACSGAFQGAQSGCTPGLCPLGVCCRGATCNAGITSAACSSSVVGAQAGAVFPVAAVCNSAGNTVSPCCYADYNKIGGITVGDIFDFLNDWFAGKKFALVGGDGAHGTLAVQNIFDFLNVWFGGC